MILDIFLSPTCHHPFMIKSCFHFQTLLQCAPFFACLCLIPSQQLLSPSKLQVSTHLFLRLSAHNHNALWQWMQSDHSWKKKKKGKITTAHCIWGTIKDSSLVLRCKSLGYLSLWPSLKLIKHKPHRSFSGPQTLQIPSGLNALTQSIPSVECSFPTIILSPLHILMLSLKSIPLRRLSFTSSYHLSHMN